MVADLLCFLSGDRGRVLKERGTFSLMTFGILRLGDAVQRWLRHPEPSSSSQKSTIKKSFLMILLFQSSFRLSEKNEKDKKRKEFLF